MDIAQIFGDYVHLLGMVILLAKLWFTKTCAGISGKTQILHAMVFTTRYSDLFVRYISLYNTILKIVYLSISYCTVLSIFLFFRNTYDRKRDSFRFELLVIPCAIYALFMNYEFQVIEVLWTFSIYLESVAIVPQVYLVSKSKQVDSIIVSYIACLGLYRGCYFMHWMYRYGILHGSFDKISIASGIVQLMLYCDFFARNLPIMKSKNYPVNPLDQDKEAAFVNSVAGNMIKNVQVSPEDPPILPEMVNCKTMQSMVVLTPGALTTEEKITLLTSKDEGTSN